MSLPKWDVWEEGDELGEADPSKIEAMTACDAAEKFVQDFDSDSTKQLLGDGFLILVRHPEYPTIRRIRVKGEATIDYEATEEKEEAPK